MTYGRWSVQASKQTYTHTGAMKVTLVWGSLRLAPIMSIHCFSSNWLQVILKATIVKNGLVCTPWQWNDEIWGDNKFKLNQHYLPWFDPHTVRKPSYMFSRQYQGDYICWSAHTRQTSWLPFSSYILLFRFHHLTDHIQWDQLCVGWHCCTSPLKIRKQVGMPLHILRPYMNNL